MSSLPTLIFCHGAWHTSEYWDTVMNDLQNKGYKCLAPALIYNGGEKPIQTMTPVVAALQEVVADETGLGNDVVLVNHSMGGMAGCSAVRGFTRKDPSKRKSEKSGHVTGLIQITAWTPSEHETSLVNIGEDFARRHPEIMRARIKHKIDDEGWCEVQDEEVAVKFFYNDMPREDAAKWSSKLIKFSAAMFGARDSVYAGWRDVPVWYLICSTDNAIKKELQEDMVQKCRALGADITTRECEAGHSPMLSKPGETVVFIEDAVRAFYA
ncbi:uncharacterized protein Z520_08700 [Fonsecaea multimorphosa CBS 102226]|uniref:AB hydrolase-1 domain-containing protein n=1 Tax=Fonsecaea multimorphosa CBS 102226 TaxID=1442371 RepID=A0A0D2H167_9EURO|nr:uncharacterized protein Z520_08700 [Fonsecaea multimorphosa CBS 102226]KIX95580.1 hypothetical protein Z520_08700 [Fonsecaea multimorphosa CBS 102226]OAL21187.1 hypothetical protein AYO22_08150 [Fonsecaea multimorphosa]